MGRTELNLLAGAAFALALLVAPVSAMAICGNGILEGGEECDPGGPLYENGNSANATCTSGNDCFYELSCCKFNCQSVGSGIPCSDGNECTTLDTCNQDGDCVASTFATSGSVCGDPNNTECDLTDTCDGSGTCLDNLVATGTDAPSLCTDSNDCTFNQCDGGGGCLNPNLSDGDSCGDPTNTECNLSDTCDGAGSCQVNNVAISTLCGDGNQTECDAPDTCDGSGSCLSNPEPVGTSAPNLCDDSQFCTNDQCNGSGGCQNPNLADGTECRASVGACDIIETCLTGVCPGDSLVSAGTECRALTEFCDPAEQCTGASGTCPSDSFRADGTECRSTAGGCDIAETCASGTCPTDSLIAAGTECRSSTELCDPAEQCTGTGPTCPTNAFLPDGSECRASVGACDIVETCTAGSCPTDVVVAAGTECRSSTEFCDPSEQCSGSNGNCPADAFLADSTECRAAAGACDIAETCASGTCPTDSLSTAECRGSGGPCNPAEVCDGVNLDCPADEVAADGTACPGDNCVIVGTCQATVCETDGPALLVTGRSLMLKDMQIDASIRVENERGQIVLGKRSTFGDNTEIAAHRVFLGIDSSAYHITANVVGGPGDVRGTITPAFALSGASAFCALPTFSCGGVHAIVPPGQTRTLSPGTYNIASVEFGGTLELEEGAYYFCSMRLYPDAVLQTIPGANDPVVHIQQSLRVSKRATIGPGAGAAIPKFYIGKNASFGPTSNVVAHIFAPNDKVVFRRDAIFDGTLCAEKLTAYKRAQLTCTP